MLISGSQLVAALGAGLLLQGAVETPSTASQSAITEATISDSAITQDVIEQAQARFDAMAALYPALNATVMVGGEIVWEAEGGTARDASDGVAQDYNVYSVAKLMLALAYLRLEQETGLDLNTRVRTIDPDLPDHYEAVTLRQLLDHRAGVRHYSSDADWLGFSDRRCELPADALPHFIDAPLAPPADGEIAYSTFGYVLLSHLLVRLTGAADFDAAMHQVLGEAYQARRDHEGADKASNWIDLGNGLERVEGLSAECKFGGGGLLASSRDLAILLDALAAGDLVDPQRLEAEAGPWAGWSEEMQVHYVAHSGGSPGGRAFMFTLIEPQVVVAVTANADGPNFYELSRDLVVMFAGEDLPE